MKQLLALRGLGRCCWYGAAGQPPDASMAPCPLLALPQEALQRCLEALNAAVLAPVVGPCSSQLRKACRLPGLWRAEVERRFPDVAACFAARGAGCHWRGVLAGAVRRELDAERLAHLAREHRCREELHKLQASRERLRGEVDSLASRRGRLREHLSELRNRAARLDSWQQAPSGLAGSERRAAARRLWESLEELRGEEKKVSSELSEAQHRLSFEHDAGMATSRAARLQRGLTEAEDRRKRCEARLAALPPASAGAALVRVEASTSCSAGSGQAAAAGTEVVPRESGRAPKGGPPPAAARRLGAAAAAAAAGERAAAAAGAGAADRGRVLKAGRSASSSEPFLVSKRQRQ